MESKGSTRKKSIRQRLLVVFLSALLISVTGIDTLVFHNWYKTAKEQSEEMTALMNEDIFKNISTFLHIPAHMNSMYFNFIENDLVDLNDALERSKFFAGALSAHGDEVQSFHYGTNKGEYYGAARNEFGEVELMKSNAQTGWNTWYYSVNSDMTVKDILRQVRGSDPRLQVWYKTAEHVRDLAFTPVYRFMQSDSLCITSVQPVYDQDGVLDGVLGTSMLLSVVDEFLVEAAQSFNGYAIVLDKTTGERISSSFKGDFNTERIYNQYMADQLSSFMYEGNNNNYYISAKELAMEGLDWIVLTAIPESLLFKPVVDNIRFTILLVIIVLLLAFAVYYIITNSIMRSISDLVHVAEALSAGDLTQRVKITDNDEIGRISESFNRVADTMKNIIDNLENTVENRTEQLVEAIESMTEHKENLQLILDSTGEGIYGNDPEGRCTFCNVSCLRILGYTRQEDLIGKNMHELIHHSKEDGQPLPVEECRIMKSLVRQTGDYVDDEVFWRADGTPVKVEYRSYPQVRNGKVVGVVVTFSDITLRKEREDKIQYLYDHDTLTGLFNRNSIEQKLEELNKPEYLPLSLIFADINGLKMTNDIFSHKAGDALIKKSSQILLESCREEDVIARIGGDEFIILMPKTGPEEAQAVMDRIRQGFSDARVEAVKCSISLGAKTKTDERQSIDVIMSEAENAMYIDKSMNRNAVNTDIIQNIIDTLHAKSPDEKLHSQHVAKLCERMGEALNLPNVDVSKLKRAGYLHDIGKIVLIDSVFNVKSPDLYDSDEMKQHSVAGYRIMNLFDETVDLAEAVYYHHERWDGNGYPRGIKKQEIPFISRIISVVETYDRIVSRYHGSLEGKRYALQVIREEAGKRFDPDLTELFIELILRREGLIDEKEKGEGKEENT